MVEVAALPKREGIRACPNSIDNSLRDKSAKQTNRIKNDCSPREGGIGGLSMVDSPIFSFDFRLRLSFHNHFHHDSKEVEFEGASDWVDEKAI